MYIRQQVVIIMGLMITGFSFQLAASDNSMIRVPKKVTIYSGKLHQDKSEKMKEISLITKLKDEVRTCETSVYNLESMKYEETKIKLTTNIYRVAFANSNLENALVKKYDGGLSQYTEVGTDETTVNADPSSRLFNEIEKLWNEGTPIELQDLEQK